MLHIVNREILAIHNHGPFSSYENGKALPYLPKWQPVLDLQ